MTGTSVCPTCGASSPAQAEWCNQCYSSFSPQPTVSPDVVVAQETLAAAATTRPVMAQGRWSCSRCGTISDTSEDQCRVCGRSIFDEFAPDEPDEPAVEVSTVLTWALIPGFGHAKAGHGLLGTVIGTFIFVAAGLGALLLASGARGFGAFEVLLAVGVWAVSFMDAGRIARGRPDEILIRPRIITILAGASFLAVLFRASQV